MNAFGDHLVASKPMVAMITHSFCEVPQMSVLAVRYEAWLATRLHSSFGRLLNVVNIYLWTFLDLLRWLFCFLILVRSIANFSFTYGDNCNFSLRGRVLFHFCGIFNNMAR
jgi:hypothetical protein